ncbi:MAG: response regulator transcription factor [Actinobacteria bacterium]|nr:response regulator transcription factor [Actinomycetota bacterium]
MELVSFNLKKSGYQVVQAGDGEAALDLARKVAPDLVILDLMLPGVDGLEVCREIRRKSWVPIIMVTARREEVDRVVGLELGADDYLTKPFSPRELIARVRAQLRRASVAGAAERAGAAGRRSSDGNPRDPDEAPLTREREDAAEIISSGELVIDLGKHRVSAGGREVELTPTEFELLRILASNPGQAFTREILLDKVWGMDFYGDQRTVDVHVRHLREKIEEDPARPRYIETVRGVGYRFREKDKQ